MEQSKQARGPARVNRQRLLKAALYGLSLSLLANAGMVKADAPLEQVLPFARPDLAKLRASKHKAFANWHVWPVSVDNVAASKDWYAVEEMSPNGHDGTYYAAGGRMRERPIVRPVRTEQNWQQADMRDEVHRAAAIGLDGFAFSLCKVDGPPCWTRFLNMLDAAADADKGFKIIPMLDMPSLQDDNLAPEKAAAQIASIAKHPAVFRHTDGRMVLSAMTAERKPPEWHKKMLNELKRRGVGVFYFPLFQGINTDYAPFSDGLANWGPGTPGGATLTAKTAARVHALGKLFMQTARPQNFRPKAGWYNEAANSLMLRNSMADAITGGADWMHIVSWSDRTEHTQIAPSTGTQFAFYDLAAYYLTWFKMRTPPTITRDVLSYFHRLHWTSTAPNKSKQPKPFTLQGSQPATNDVELLAFLKTPGTIEIKVAGKVYRKDAPAGMTSFRAPLGLGKPEFRLYRDGKTVVSLQSAFEVRGKVDWQDMLYRGGSSTRPPVEMVANPPVIK
jgi:hypothetical protein